jgi:hypothetical protein
VADAFLDSDGNTIQWRRGTSPTHTVQVYEKGTTNPKNLTGATEIAFAMGAARGATARQLLLNMSDGITHNGAGGVISIPFSTAQTEAMTPGRPWCELWITDSAGRRDLILEGLGEVFDTLIDLT